MSSPSKGRSLRSILTAGLCGLFFLLAMGLTLLASGVYRQVAADGAANDSRRTAPAYLLNQVRRADRAGSLSLIPFGEGDALCLQEEGFYTLLYCHQGWLYELYAQDLSLFTPEDGSPVLPLEAMSIGLSDGLLTFTLRADGQEISVSVAPRAALIQEGQP